MTIWGVIVRGNLSKIAAKWGIQLTDSPQQMVRRESGNERLREDPVSIFIFLAIVRNE